MSLEFNDENCSVCAVYHLFLAGNLQGWEAQTWSSQVFLQKGSIKISGLFLEVQRLLEVPDWVLQSETSLLQRENFCAWQNWMHIFTKLDNTLPRQATDSFLGSIYCSPDLPVASTGCLSPWSLPTVSPHKYSSAQYSSLLTSGFPHGTAIWLWPDIAVPGTDSVTGKTWVFIVHPDNRKQLALGKLFKNKQYCYLVEDNGYTLWQKLFF